MEFEFKKKSILFLSKINFVVWKRKDSWKRERKAKKKHNEKEWIMKRIKQVN